MVRAWDHVDFVGHPFTHTPPHEFSLEKILKSHFQLESTATVRHPLQQWFATKKYSMHGSLKFKDYIKNVRIFSEKIQPMGFIHFEDFIKSPQQCLEALCHNLKVPYDKDFIHNWKKDDFITGTDIGKVIRPPLDYNYKLPEAFVAELLHNQDYASTLALLNYGDWENA